MEFVTCWVLKSKVFGQKLTVVKWNCRLSRINLLPWPQKVPKSAKIVLSKLIFYVKNQLNFPIFFSLKNINLGNHCDLRVRGAPVCQNVPKSYFQSQFSMSKINRFFFNFFFIEEYQFRRPFFVERKKILTSILESVCY